MQDAQDYDRERAVHADHRRVPVLGGVALIGSRIQKSTEALGTGVNGNVFPSEVRSNGPPGAGKGRRRRL